VFGARARARPGTPRGDALAPFPFPAPARSPRVGATRSCLSTKLERARPTDRDRAPTNPSRSSAPTRDSPRSTTAPDPPPSPRAASLVGPPRTTRLLTRSEARRLATLSARANGSLYRAGVTADAAPAPSRHGPPRDAGGRRALAGADGARSRRSAGGARELCE